MFIRLLLWLINLACVIFLYKYLRLLICVYIGLCFTRYVLGN
jgi:hypothetical protein